MPIVRVLCIVLLAVWLCGTAAGAQSLPIGLPHADPHSSPTIQQDGVFTTSPVSLDGVVLLRLAAPASPPPGTVPLAARVIVVQNTIGELIAPVPDGRQTTTAYDPDTLRIELRQEHGQDVLAAVDAKHRTALPIVTVTSVDAQYHNTDVDTLAARWQAHLQASLQHALEIRQPDTREQSIDNAVRAAIALVVFTAAVLAGVAGLRRQIEALEDQLLATEQVLDEEASDTTQPPLERRRRVVDIALSEIAPERRLHLYTLLASLLLWLLLLVWFIAVSWGLSLFPQTAATARSLWRGGFRVAATWIVTAILDRLLGLAISRLGAASRIRRYASADERARTMMRIPTITNAISGFKTFILVFMAVLATLSEIGIPVGSVITIGGVVAIGVSLAAQNFVRDFVNGFLILFEDQYVIGDFVTINAYSGMVEHLTLRMTQLRDVSGNLVTIPHSSVSSVVNHSRNWARIDYRLSLHPTADLKKALGTVRAAVEELAGERPWRGAIFEVEWIGVDALSSDWTLLRASIKIAPLRQKDLRRELNARVREALADAGLPLGAPIPAEFVPPA
jgi:moderate conductance mechanosensitive channel